CSILDSSSTVQKVGRLSCATIRLIIRMFSSILVRRNVACLKKPQVCGPNVITLSKENPMSMRNCVKRQSNGARSILFLVFALLLGCSSAFAQGTSSSAVGGTITDQTGGLIKGASVTVANKANGQTRTATTNDSGEYKFDFLPAGRYDI